MHTSLDQLSADITPEINDVSHTASVTMRIETTGADGEQYVVPSARGRLTSVTFSVEAGEIPEYVEEASRRLHVLIAAGLFADLRVPEEFPGLENSDLKLSVSVVL